MTVVDAVRDPQALTLTITSQLAAPRERAWRLWSDPRQLERWWGPPGWPATFVTHDLVEGGEARYYMTGPDGTKAAGWWRFLRIEEPAELEIEDGFGEAPHEAAPGMPVGRMVARLDEHEGGTRMTITSYFATAQDLEQVLAMGMQEGMTLALGQIDAILAEG